MTDARLPDSWLLAPRMERLSDRAWRTWTNALMFCNGQGTDGLVVRTSFRFLYPEGVGTDVLDELLEAELIEITDDGGLQVLNWVGIGQSLASTVDQRRESNRKRQQAYRERQTGTVTNDEHRHVTRDVTGNRGGQGQGQEELQERFARAYEHWPKKVARKKAEQRFISAAKTVNPDELEAHVTRFGDAYKAAGTEKRFVPALDAWIFGERWTDDLPERDEPVRRDPDSWMQGGSASRSISPEQMRATRDRSLRKTFNDQDDD